METVLTVTFCKYNTSTRYLKIFSLYTTKIDNSLK